MNKLIKIILLLCIIHSLIYKIEGNREEKRRMTLEEYNIEVNNIKLRFIKDKKHDNPLRHHLRNFQRKLYMDKMPRFKAKVKGLGDGTLSGPGTAGAANNANAGTNPTTSAASTTNNAGGSAGGSAGAGSTSVKASASGDISLNSALEAAGNAAIGNLVNKVNHWGCCRICAYKPLPDIDHLTPLDSPNNYPIVRDTPPTDEPTESPLESELREQETTLPPTTAPTTAPTTGGTTTGGTTTGTTTANVFLEEGDLTDVGEKQCCNICPVEMMSSLVQLNSKVIITHKSRVGSGSGSAGSRHHGASYHNEGHDHTNKHRAAPGEGSVVHNVYTPYCRQPVIDKTEGKDLNTDPNAVKDHCPVPPGLNHEVGSGSESSGGEEEKASELEYVKDDDYHGSVKLKLPPCCDFCNPNKLVHATKEQALLNKKLEAENPDSGEEEKPKTLDELAEEQAANLLGSFIELNKKIKVNKISSKNKKGNFGGSFGSSLDIKLPSTDALKDMATSALQGGINGLVDHVTGGSGADLSAGIETSPPLPTLALPEGCCMRCQNFDAEVDATEYPPANSAVTKLDELKQ